MKSLQRIHHTSAMHWVGNGFPVRGVFDYNGLGRELSPFLLLDYAAPYDFPPGSGKRGVGAHPHKGFETVTVVFDGELEHRDSGGGGGRIGPGDVQWMTAGSGIVHEEFHSAGFTRSGGRFHMVQLWVNLRAKDKGVKPGYQTLLRAHIPVVPLTGDAGSVRVIAGAYGGRGGAARTHSPIDLWDVSVRGGGGASLPLAEGHTAAFLLIAGEVTVAGGATVRDGDLALFTRAGAGVDVRAQADSRLLVLGGEPFDEPIVGQGPFVMNSRAEIEEAFREYEQGRMGEIGP